MTCSKYCFKRSAFLTWKSKCFENEHTQRLYKHCAVLLLLLPDQFQLINATKNVIQRAVSSAVRMMSRRKNFDVMVSLSNGKPLGNRKKSCLFSLPSAPVNYSLKLKDFKYLEIASLSKIQEENSELPQHKPQSGAKRSSMKIRSRNYTDLSPRFHALYSSLRSYNAKERVKRQIAVIRDTTSCYKNK